ncbi:MAG: GNAT family N-acetyltransferase [Saprospiraceae bacterium]|nr:GNAT family N-acetyltransferase [Saprospiraceae bacterium]
MTDFQLRPWRLDDLTNLVRFANNPLIAANLNNQFPHPYTPEDGEQFIRKNMEADPTRVFAIEIDGTAAGASGLHPQADIFCKNLEIGYWLAEPYWGRGIMTEVVRQMVRYGFGHFDVTRIYARAFGPNIGSQRVLEKAGFTLEARFEKTLFKNGAFMDELIYAVRRPNT